jgi:exopolyphosphatase/guanosine-5'-triphosphate,3'-diphosphate pyrophosphatase
MPRLAAIDVGTNSVKLLVAERSGPRLSPLLQRVEVTQLGRGVDQARRLTPEAISQTVAAIGDFAADAKRLGATEIFVCATSAARDAANAAELVAAVKARTGLVLEVLSGVEEATLSFAAVAHGNARLGQVVVLDIGGGSTEVISGEVGQRVHVRTRQSLDQGALRLTERHLAVDAEGRHLPEGLAAARRTLKAAVGGLGQLAGGTVVGIGGTVTTLLAITMGLEPYDPERVHGQWLSLAQTSAWADRLAAMTSRERRAVPGLPEKREGVICGGALVLEAALSALGATGCVVSDRGLRWGLLFERSSQEGGHANS